MANEEPPEITYYVGYLSSFIHEPKEPLRKAGENILWYLSGRKYLGIVYRNGAITRFKSTQMQIGDGSQLNANQ